jgi:hypothetical protein
MEKKIVTSLAKNNKAVIKDYVSGTTKNIEHAFGEQSDELVNVLKSQKSIIDDLKIEVKESSEKRKKS